MKGGGAGKKKATPERPPTMIWSEQILVGGGNLQPIAASQSWIGSLTGLYFAQVEFFGSERAVSSLP